MFGSISPREDQLTEIAFLEFKRRAAIHSAPGKGKTLSAAYAAIPPVIISAPGYMVQKWADWLRRVMPPEVADHVYIASSSKMDKYDRFNAIAEAAEDPLHWLLIGHDMLRPETTEYETAGRTRKRVTIDKHGWRMEYPLPPAETAIIDEAHWLRGRNAGRSQGAVTHFKNTPRIYQLTASPIYRDPDDLYQQLRILQPNIFTSYHKFVASYLKVWSDGWKDHIVGIKNPALWEATLGEFAIRHDYKPGELPPSMELDPILIEPDTTTKKRLQELRRRYRDGVDIYATAIEALLAIDRITATSPAKLGSLVSWIDDNRSRMDGTKRGALVLCHYKETVEAVKEALVKAIPKFEAVCITGDTPQERRSRMVEAASNVIGTWGSMSEGIDASHLRLVVPYELDWTFGSSLQGVGRVLRPRVLTPDDFEPVLIQSIQLKFSGDTIKASKVKGRANNAREALAQTLAQGD